MVKMFVLAVFVMAIALVSVQAGRGKSMYIFLVHYVAEPIISPLVR